MNIGVGYEGTLLLSAYAKLRYLNYAGLVVGLLSLYSEDTDVFVQAAYVSQQLPGDMLNKQKNTIINALLSDIMVPLHVIVGSYHTSGFHGHEKKQVIHKVITDPEADIAPSTG